MDGNLSAKKRKVKMARFNLDDYETVESRIKRFYEAYPDGRIVTEWCNEFAEQGEKRLWVMKATIYLDAGDQANKLPKATGYATETDGTGGANNVDAAANGETSCIGRALANMGLSGNKRSSREEMAKVNRVEQQSAKDWLKEADKVMNIDGMRWLYAQAKQAGADPEVLEGLADRAKILSPEGEGSGAGGSVPRGTKSGVSK
jgi:hypothetical protein